MSPEKSTSLTSTLPWRESWAYKEDFSGLFKDACSMKTSTGKLTPCQRWYIVYNICVTYKDMYYKYISLLEMVTLYIL